MQKSDAITSVTVTIDQNSSIEQPSTAGGAVKTMLHFSPNNNGRIISCFNSNLSGAAATTPPCGFTFDITGTGDYIFDFGFRVDDRIYSTTPGTCTVCVVNACGNQDGQCLHTGTLTNDQVEVTSNDYLLEASFDAEIYLIVY